MVTVNCDSLKTIVNDSTIADATAEIIIDQAINKLNTNKLSISNLTGAAGSKTGTYTSAEAGAIVELAVAIYSQTYKSAGASSSSYAIGVINKSQSTSTSMGASSLQELAKSLADQLRTKVIYRT